jgi:ATP-dependent DNA helicase DinG
MGNDVNAALTRVTSALPGAEERPGQHEMAAAVAAAVDGKRHLIVQGGTGTGKCLHSDTQITLADGSLVPISDLADATPQVAALSRHLQIRPRAATTVFRSGVKPLLRLRTRLGHELIASADHPVLAVGGWVRLGELGVGTHIATARRVRVRGTGRLPSGEIRFLAHMISEGGCATSGPRSALRFTNFDPAIVIDWKSAAASLPNTEPTDLSRHGHYGVRRRTMAGHARNGAYALLERCGVLGVLSKDKRVPAEVLQLRNPQVALFLGRLFSGDGCVEAPRSVVSYTSASLALVEGVRALLLRFGIVSSVRRRNVTLNGRTFVSWTLQVRGSEPVRLFAQQIGPFLVGAKAGRLRRLVASLPAWNPNLDLVPAEAWELVDKSRQRAGISWNAIRDYAGVASDRRRGISRRALALIADLCDDPELMQLACSDIYWDAVATIEPCGTGETYDITMEGSPNFLASGIIVHNSIAYLVPAILSGQKIVVATATKALQDQLAGKDLPFLATHLDRPFSFSVMKGRSNYLCRQRAYEVTDGDDQLTLDAVADDVGVLGRQIAQLVEWGRTAESGDRADLDFEPKPRAWSAVSVSAMECPGAIKCPRGEECFAELARRKADEADVVVVNTHLYGAHLASGGHVLPEHDVVVFDEAHELEDIAASSLGLELGAGRLRALARGARRLVADAVAADDVAGAGDLFEAALDQAGDRRLPVGLTEPLGLALQLIDARVANLTSALRAVKTDDPAKARWLQAAGHLQGDVAFLQGAGEDDVVWVDGPPHNRVLKVAPVDVGERLAAALWGDVTAVLTSATIPPRLGARLGLDPDTTDELDAGSPFDFESHALLYCARHLPDPRQPTYEAAMHDELHELISAAGGRTLALFTSWRAMQAAAEAMQARLPFTILTQSDLPKPALVAAFTTDETSCLFATMGFWQGVDVPGPSLSMVVIDKIPFPRPDEPLVQARRDKAGPAAFRLVDLPRAATLLAQGAGRLIRTATDRGVVAVLDPRLSKANYAQDLVKALPPMRRTRQLADVVSFFEGFGVGQ